MSQIATWHSDENAGEWSPLDYTPPAPPANTIDYWNHIWTDNKRLNMGGWNISHALPFTAPASEYFDDTDYEYMYNHFPELLG